MGEFLVERLLMFVLMLNIGDWVPGLFLPENDWCESRLWTLTFVFPWITVTIVAPFLLGLGPEHLLLYVLGIPTIGALVFMPYLMAHGALRLRGIESWRRPLST